MSTERPSPRYSGIDVWDPSDILDAIIEGQFAAVAAVRAVRPAIARAASAIEARLRDSGRLIYAGAGTSGRLAVQDGAELIPTFDWPPEALLKSIEGAEDETEHAVRLVRKHNIHANDVVIAVAASGKTPFTLACLRESKERGALTVGIANNRGTPILEEADHPIWLDTGSEPIAGSTRMNAGTSQRITLNLLSSLVMILLGRVYEGLMVDLKAVNEKLVQRSENILMRLTSRSREDARAALKRADGSIKVAVLLLHGCDLNEATTALNRTGGQLRRALALLGKPGSESGEG
jgi:N-acetylmuramic acid 6-phosphate etherase